MEIAIQFIIMEVAVASDSLKYIISLGRYRPILHGNIDIPRNGSAILA